MKKIAIDKSSIIDVVRTTLVAVIISLVMVLVFSLIINFVKISDNLIMGINQGIKVISIFVGCFIGIKSRKNGVLKGALSGLLYTLISIFIFSIISHSVRFSSLNLIDIALGIVAGGVSGVLAVNLKK